MAAVTRTGALKMPRGAARRGPWNTVRRHPTAVLGAILLTGYLGGAVATHVRIGDPSFLIPFGLGVVAWAGLYFREERLRARLPLRRAAAPR